MKQIRNLNIWKESTRTIAHPADVETDIDILSLSVRANNCLRRAGICTIRELQERIQEEKGLKSIRNLGSKSEQEISERLTEYLAENVSEREHQNAAKPILLKPANVTRTTPVTAYSLQPRTKAELTRCGIRTIGDLYRKEYAAEPGWFAVRELFEKILDTY